MKIAYTKPNGELAIFYAVAKACLEKAVGTLTDEQYRAHIWERAIPSDAQNAVELPSGWRIPDDHILRRYRDAWTLRKDFGIDVDMPRARDIHRNRLRHQRTALLQDLDIAALRALEAQDITTAGEITAKKQKLRDAPAHPSIEAAKTPFELSALTLDALTHG